MKAADIPDETFLAIVRQINFTPWRRKVFGMDLEADGHWAMIWDLQAALPEFPEKVIRAKARNLMKRGLLGGCTCGCRGDFAVPESDLFY